MKLLLDTHILLWALAGDEKLSDKAIELIENVDNDIYYSMISLWEIELKRIAHPEANMPTAKQISEFCEQAGFYQLTIHSKHIFDLQNLKQRNNSPIHKDPFDRLLICQANIENMMLLTHDSLIPTYNSPWIIEV